MIELFGVVIYTILIFAIGFLFGLWEAVKIEAGYYERFEGDSR